MGRYGTKITDEQRKAIKTEEQRQAAAVLKSERENTVKNTEAAKAVAEKATAKNKAAQIARNAGQTFAERKQNTARNIVQSAGQKLTGKQAAETQSSQLADQGKKAVERVTGKAGQKLTDEQIALGLVTKVPALSLNSGAGIMARQAERKARFDQAAKATELESERQQRLSEDFKRRYVEPVENAKAEADDAAENYKNALADWTAAVRRGAEEDEVNALKERADNLKVWARDRAYNYQRTVERLGALREREQEEAARQAAARRAKLEYDLEQAQMRQAETGRQLAPLMLRQAGENLAERTGQRTGPYGFGELAEMPGARRAADIIRAAAYGNLAGYANAVGMLDPYAEAVSQDEGSILAGNYHVPQMRTAGQAHMQSLARQWDELGRTSLERAKTDLSTGGQVAVEIGVAALQMLGDIAISQGRGTLYAMTVRAGGGYAMEAARDGASQNEQFVYGLAGGAVEAATEKIFAVAPLFNKVFGKPIIKTDFANSAIKTLARTAKSPTGRAIVDRAAHGLLAMTSEGAEEVLADFMEPVIRKATYDRDGRIEIDWEQMLHDGIIGAALGGLGVPGIIARSGRVRSGYELDEALDKYQAAIIEHGILSDEARQASMNVWRMTGKLSTQDVAAAVSERLAVDPEAAAREPGVRYWLAKSRGTERAPAEAAEPVMPGVETQRIEDEEAAPAEAVAPAVGEAAPPATDVAPSPLRRGGLSEEQGDPLGEVPAPVLPGMDELRTQGIEDESPSPVEAAPNEGLSSEFADRIPMEAQEREKIPAPVLPGMEELRTQGIEDENAAPSAGEAESGTAAPMGVQAERSDEVPAPVLPGAEAPESAGQRTAPAQSESGTGTVSAGDRLTMYDGNAYTVNEVSPTGISITNENGEASALTWDMLEGLQRAGAVTIERSGENGLLPSGGQSGEPGGRAGGQAEGLETVGAEQTPDGRGQSGGGRTVQTNYRQGRTVSAREIGLEGGTEERTARLIAPEDITDPRHRQLAERIRAAGYEPMLFTGRLAVDTGEGPQAVNGFRQERDGRRYLGVKLDSVNPRLTPEKVAAHELAHEEFVTQPLIVRHALQQLERDYGEALYDLLTDYYRTFNGVYGRNWERYLEEIFCDMQAGIRRRGAEIPDEARAPLEQALNEARRESGTGEGRAPPREGGERYSIAADEEVPAPVLPGLEDIAGAADEKRAAAAARVSDQTLKNNIRERRRQIEDIENLIGGGEANPGQARKLETLRAELRAMETELKKRTGAEAEEKQAEKERRQAEKERRQAERAEQKQREKQERPARKAKRKAEVLGLPADYADPLSDNGEGKGSAQEAVKAAETAEKAERKKGRKKTAKPHRAAAETAKKLVGLFAAEKEDRARAEQLVMDALVGYAQRGGMTTGEVRELVDGLFALGTVEDEARYPEAEDFRKQMRRRRIYVSDELKKEFGDEYDSLRKRAFSAGIYFVNDRTGMAPHMVNQELAEKFPGFFDAQEADMGAVLEKIVGIAEEGQAERLSMEDFLQTLAETNTDYARDYARETEAKVRKYLLEFAKNFKLEAAMDKYWAGQLWEQEKRHERDIKARDRHEESRARELAREQIIKDRAKRAEDRRAASQWRKEQQERKAVFNMIQQAAKMSRKVNLGTISEMEAAIGDADLDAIRLIKPAERTAEQKARMEIAEARAALAEAIVGIDTMARRLSNQGIENREKLAEDYGRLMAEKGENFIPIKGIEQRIAQLNQKQINDMKIEDVRELAKTLSEMINQVETGDKLLSEMRDRDLKIVTERAAREIRETKGRRSKRGKKSVPFMEELLQINQLDPGRIMSMLGGWRDSGTWEDFRRVFERATDRYMKFRGEANRLYSSFSDKAFAEYGIDEDKKGAVDYDARKKWLEKSYGRKADWQTVKVKYYDPEGVVEQMEKGELPVSTTTIEITPMMRVTLYLHAQNNSNLNHIATGGIILPDKDLYRKGKVKKAYEAGSNRRLRITPESMKTLAEDVEKNHPMEHAFAQLMLKFTDGQSKDAINRVSMLIDGWERAAVRNYWPIESAKDFVGGDASSWGDYASLQNIGSIANERVPQAGNPILLLDANDTFERQKETVAKYAGYAIPMRDLAGVLKQNFHKGAAYTGSVRDLIASKWGDEMIEYLENIQKDLSFKTSAKKIKFLNKLRGNLSGAWLLGNLSVFVSQSSAYVTALPYLDMKALGHGMKFWNKVDTDLISKYTGVYDYREASGYSPEAMDWLKSNNPTARFVGKHKKANLAEVGDSFWIRRLWAACEYQVNKDTDLNIFGTVDEFYEAVAELFRKVVFHTQYNSSTFQRSALLRDERDIMRLLTMFKTDAFQHYGMVYEALGRLGRARQELSEARTDEEKAEARRNFSDKKKNLARNLTAVVMSEAVWSGIKGGFKVLRGSAGAFATGAGAVTVGSFAAGTVALTMESLAGSVFLGEEVYQYLLAFISKLFPGDDDDDDKKAAGLLKRDYYGFDLNVVGEITDYAEDWLSLGAAIGSAGADWKKQAKGVATSTLEFTGMPVGTVTRSLENILRMAYPKGRYKLDNFWKPLEKTALAKVPESARPAAISVLFGNRVEISDGAAEELARLYDDYGGDVLPAKLPTSISVDGEDVKLDVDKLNKYKGAWGKAFGGQLEALIKSPTYTAADDADRVKLIKTLYDYAGQLAKQEAVGAEPDKWVLQSRDLTTGGAATLPEILAYKQSGGQLDTLTKYLDEGMSVEGAVTAAGVLGELEPEDGKSQVSNGQKLMALGTELGDQKDKDAAAHKILSSESAVAKYDEAIKAGLTTYEYGACLSAIGGVKPHEGRQDANQWQKVMALDDALKDQKDVQTAAKILVLDGGTAEDYDAAIKVGFSSYEYAEMQDGFTTVEPHEGRKEASYDQKLNVIVKTISPHRQVEAAKTITESEEGKANLDKVIDAGISLSTYADYQEALNVTYAHDDVDESGEKIDGSRKKHMFEYVDGLPLTAQQKSVLIGTKYAESTVEKERLW